MIEAAKRASLAANERATRARRARHREGGDPRARESREPDGVGVAAIRGGGGDGERNDVDLPSPRSSPREYERCVELQRAAEEAAKDPAIVAARRRGRPASRRRRIRSPGGVAVGATAKLGARATDFKPAHRDGPRRIDRDATDLAVHAAER